jgi:hypothetical protein
MIEDVTASDVSVWHLLLKIGDTVQEIVNDNIEVLRARAERYRRLANDLFDPRTSEEAVTLAQELDDEIARLLTQPQATLTAHCH